MAGTLGMLRIDCSGKTRLALHLPSSHELENVNNNIIIIIYCRYLADAAPQKGEASMRSGAQAPDEDSTRQFKAQSQRLMGDMNDAGDAPFGGEMQVDSQV